MEIKETSSEKVKIGTQFEVLRCTLSLTVEETAKLLLQEQEEIERIGEQENGKISVNVLYASYFFANQILENAWKEAHVHMIARDLKKMCVEEIRKRTGM